MKLFLSGAISNYPNYKKEFEFFKYKLEQMGHTVISPADVVPPNIDYEEQMKLCFILIDFCQAVCFMPNWHSSSGSRRENMHAQSHKYKRYYFSADRESIYEAE